MMEDLLAMSSSDAALSQHYRLLCRGCWALPHGLSSGMGLVSSGVTSLLSVSQALQMK